MAGFLENSWLPYEFLAFMYRVDDGARHSIKKKKYEKRACCMDEMPAVSTLYTTLATIAVSLTARLWGNLYHTPEISSKVCELENEICAISLEDQWAQKRSEIANEIPIFFMGQSMEDLFNQIIEEQIGSNSSDRVSASFTFMNSLGIQDAQQVQPYVHTLTFAAPKCKLFIHKNIAMTGLINETNQRITYQYKIDSEGKIINSVTVYDPVSHTSLLFSAVVTNSNDSDQSQFSSLAEHQQLPMDILQQVSSYVKDTNDSVVCSADETADPASYTRLATKAMAQTARLGGKRNQTLKTSSKVCKSEKVSRPTALTDKRVKKKVGITGNDMDFTNSCLNIFAHMFIEADNPRTKNHPKDEAYTSFSEEIIKENSSTENHLKNQISVACPEEMQSYLLECLPDELYEIICKKMNLSDVISLSQVNNKLYKKTTLNILYKERCRELFSSYSPQLQTLFKNHTKDMNDKDILAIISRYSTDVDIGKALIIKCDYFIEILLYEIRQLKYLVKLFN